MKRVHFILCLMLAFGACAPHKHQGASDAVTSHLSKPSETLVYSIDLDDRADDIFKVSLSVSGLSTENAIYQFASTAPGAYQRLDIGRYVRSFTAFDGAGNEIDCQKRSTNQWEISKPEAVSRIEYQIAETWDTKVDGPDIYPMLGTSMEADHVQFLTNAVLGYPTGMQQTPIKLKLDYPESWLVGTALERDEEGYFLAENYDHAVDSPILLGKLSHASMTIRNSTVEFYCYSKSGEITADYIMSETSDMVEAVAAFLDGFPVDRYTFLYLVEDKGTGAWEHSYSSNYTIPEQIFELLKNTQLDGIVSHEIFHILTPLNLHSEIIERFNFVTPNPSDHLWLYEGATEWAAQMMRLRDRAIDLPTYLGVLSHKMSTASMMSDEISLVDLARASYTPEGSSQYQNIYMRGALTVGLLDIHLLELSGGKRGMRELMLELAADYGKNKAFSEKDFFMELERRTDPSVGTFIADYIAGTKPLPISEYFAKIGLDYIPRREEDNVEPYLGFGIRPAGTRAAVSKVSPKAAEAGMQDGDLLSSWNGVPVTEDNMGKIGGFIHNQKPGDTFELEVERNGEIHKLSLVMQERRRAQNHVFEPNPEASETQVALREAWMKEL